ncbi:hypothetical protein ALC57_18021 [Trachymyrmex cornetzi]|uniref:Uncharacterized protein n=1 Tax=Trachymyrmex cornetzi TaxID=471704 RepID=A0A151ISV3_9HYME|nr:hypothetical protein ALC57_18021 [Trachymyrmex cornetzi]
MKTETADKMKNRERTSSEGGLVAEPSTKHPVRARVESIRGKNEEESRRANDRGSGIKWNSARAEL